MIRKWIKNYLAYQDDKHRMRCRVWNEHRYHGMHMHLHERILEAEVDRRMRGKSS